MEAQTECSTTEIKQLRRCINDLISVLALPAMWSGGEPAQIVRTLLDVLLDMLNLDMVYVRIEDQAGNAPLEIVRAAQSQSLAVGPQEMGELLNRSLGDEPQKWPPFLRNRIGDADLSLVPLRLGLQGELGVIVAGSQRPGFPGQTERLLLSVAANQALIGLQGGRLLSEQKRVATELDQRVAQRTSELAAANEELKMEIAERKLAEEAFNRIQSELTHVSRVTTLGELTASIAHEVNQPLGSVINNANACLNLLSNDPPQLNEVRDALEEIIQGTDQASAVILRVKQMVRKAPSDRTVLRLSLDELQQSPQTLDTAGAEESDDRTTLKDVEREHIIRALAATNWILGGPKGAGARLGLARTTLIAKMQKLGITRAQA